jgi:hypothetical protein
MNRRVDRLSDAQLIALGLVAGVVAYCVLSWIGNAIAFMSR